MTSITIRFQGTLNITNNIDPTLSHEQILKQAKLLIEKGEFIPHNLTLEITDVADLDPPTQINQLGTKLWKNEKGQLHRIGGPAIIFSGGSQQWYQNGLIHRTDGPAAIFKDGSRFFYLNDQRLSEEEWKKQVKIDLDPPTRIDESGNQFWQNDKGQYHRIGGPAIIYASGIQQWLQNGNLHREDGPASLYPNGDKYYYLNGKPLSEKEWKEQVDPPTEINEFGTKIWKNEKGQFHRNNEPSMIFSNGSQSWHQNGDLHREDGPAIICANGNQHHYLNGIKLTKEQWKEQVK